ncbi:hypothetical protein [Falsiroseomonas stagni]|uniref:Uncharacterized protein n=1 Tax=Falsiroseomonas stagni DSM 19981 TaxID=1123062 RepID=A0A1I4CWK4_9PROT|nr:hypothetical protein SAMN02745775_108232 [Falsiroseomonas stagni DSM 19981]
MTAATSITVRVPLAIRHRPGRKTVVTPMIDGVAPVTTRADPALVKALARAFRYQRMLDQGRYASITEMAAAEKIERGYLGMLLRLTLLAPDLVEQVLDGRAADRVALPALLEPMPLAWAHQSDRLFSGEPTRPAQVTTCRVKAPEMISRALGRTSIGVARFAASRTPTRTRP